jgi:hypothetical protein
MQPEPIVLKFLTYKKRLFKKGLNFREYPQKKLAKHMVLTYLHFRILKLPLIWGILKPQVLVIHDWMRTGGATIFGRAKHIYPMIIP